MGWYYQNGGTRQGLIKELTESRENKRDDGIVVKTVGLAHCYRGNVFSGVLWTVFEHRFFLGDAEVEQPQRWIGCDLLHCHNGDWGHKPMTEHMGPYYYSVPLSYLNMVPIETYGGNAEWRLAVTEYHAKQRQKRQSKNLTRVS